MKIDKTQLLLTLLVTLLLMSGLDTFNNIHTIATADNPFWFRAIFIAIYTTISLVLWASVYKLFKVMGWKK